VTEPRSYPAGVPCWIDVEHADVEAAQAFYGGLFGWAFGDATSSSPAPYLVAHLDGQAVAGLSGGAGDSPRGWSTYVAVDDAQQVLSAITAAGGRVRRGPVAMGGNGRYAVCEDPDGVSFRLWEAGGRPGAQLVNAPGAWNFSDLHAADGAEAPSFYAGVFGWEIDDVGFGRMIRRPGYGDHLAATIDPGIHERQAYISAPPGFADAVGWMVPAQPDEPPHWHVTFTVVDRDDTAAAAERLGGVVLRGGDTDWTRDALIRDPQGAVFTASQFTLPAR
jgi:uncharacterized protein